MAQELQVPTQFTPTQLEKLRELARIEASKRPYDHDMHNLGRKLDEYVIEAKRFPLAV